MDEIEKLEHKSIYILREAYANFKSICMLWSIGKDSTVMMHLARKAFFSHVPFPLVHVDTSFKIPEMIKFRDEMVRKFKLNMIIGQNEEALKQKKTYPDNKVSRIECCKLLKTLALKQTLSGEGKRYRFDHEKLKYAQDESKEAFKGVIVGVRSDEEGSRSKERYFSARNQKNEWDIAEQAPEIWDQYKTEFDPKSHVRIHPLLDWKEVDIWRYIEREKIEVTSLYYDQGSGKRYRSLGCYPCTKPVESNAKNASEIVKELETGKFSKVAERSGREQDKEDEGGLETLRRGGYM